jgi:hypothetical protein
MRLLKTVAKRLGMKKGNLTKALEEAIQLWLTEKKEITH